ncbi:acetyltransferase (GNAT) family protein [Pseudoduganella lurida]|uniref:Acetyltransferase (GNAT) family protein n=1 Tax=Pseudoduganella lurida TaxID=1036180 RepID=A0A562QZA7_9BURK|nr:GNAT family N-acetyltransferase [Pseudoduganella lurida]TWI62148.1 acetyltransferase (GNAT) family protein [Pseudoduganella lurida]
MDNLTFRPATPEDAPAIAALIMALMPFLTQHPSGKGAEQFMASVGIDGQRRYLAQERYRYHVAMEDGLLAGIVAMRDNAHLFHLFVSESLHGKGLGRRLWELARDEAIALGNPGSFTVNAAVRVMAMYRHLGFVPEGEPVAHDGIVDVPMRWTQQLTGT